MVAQLAFVGIEAAHPVGDLALLSEALLGLEFYADVVGLDDYWLASKSSPFDRAADLVHPVAPSADQNPHSAFGLGAGVERGSHVVVLAVGGPAAAKIFKRGN